MSPGYPDKYPASIECVCNITTEIDQRILLTFADFDLEWSENCESDILQVKKETPFGFEIIHHQVRIKLFYLQRQN